MKERIVLIDAGSAVFTRGLVADLLRTGVEAEVALVDVDPEALEVAQRLAVKMIAARGAPLTIEASTDRRGDLHGNGRYYGRTLGVDAFSFEGTIATGDRGYDEMREVAFARGRLPPDYLEQLGGEHEQALDILQAIRRDSGAVFSANLPNTGQVPNLPLDAIVEAPAVATAEGLRHIAQPPLPSAIVGTLATRYQWVETIVEAALEGSRDKFIQALVLDGAVASLEQAGRLADELLQAQKAHLLWAEAPGLG